MLKRLLSASVGGMIGAALAWHFQDALGLSETLTYVSFTLGGMGVGYVESRCLEATKEIVPDVVLVLDLADDIAEARVAPSRDRLEREGGAFHAVVRQAFRDLAPGRGWVLVDASGTPKEVAARVWAVVAPLL